MLSREENELLCRVGPGTPMGDLLREYWIPALLASEVPPDAPTRRIRLLGEDLITFRDTQGRVGVMEENCPHRGSSLIVGRNEEGGVRCVYHGWKFDVEGRCLDMPSEPPNSQFKNKVRIKAYRCQERNGIVWVYMGPRQEDPPSLPDMEVNLAPIQGGEPFKYVRECNWVQALEGDIDTVHINFLHTRLDPRWYSDGRYSEANRMHQADRNPGLEMVDTPYGMYYGAIREAADDKHYVRITQFVMPFYTMVTGPGGKVWIPIDDENTLVMEWSPSRPAGMARDYDDASNMMGARQPYGYEPDNIYIPWGNWRIKANPSNYWLRDTELERTKLYSGIYSNPLQDSAVQVLMGRLYDRTREHLGTTDSAIIKVRRILINAAKALRDRKELHPTIDDPTLYRVRGAMALLPRDQHWIDATADWLKAFSDGPPPEYAVAGPYRNGVRRDVAPVSE